MKTVTSHISAFLDGVDTVLNSNTFLLTFNIEKERLEKGVRQFIDSGGFKSQILEQDQARGWNNYSKIKDEQLIKSNYKLQFHPLPLEKVETYFSSMLMAESNSYNFWSPYSKQFDKPKSIALTRGFLSALSQNQKISTCLMNTDFSYSHEEVHSKRGYMTYFEGEYGSDSATLITREDHQAFIILTNGRD